MDVDIGRIYLTVRIAVKNPLSVISIRISDGEHLGPETGPCITLFPVVSNSLDSPDQGSFGGWSRDRGDLAEVAGAPSVTRNSRGLVVIVGIEAFAFVAHFSQSNKIDLKQIHVL